MTSPTGSTDSVQAEMACVFIAIEVSKRDWLVAGHTPSDGRTSRHKCRGSDVEALLGVIDRLRQREERTARRPGEAGNGLVRTAMIELAWLWLRHQPESALSRWFVERVGNTKGRLRRIAVVALARKLLVALWRFVGTGLVPTGAVVKTA